MNTRFTCFVISPIGEPNSTTRSAADDTFEYIIRPALDKFEFAVERADHIRGITDTITKEMVERIQRSDLCIVDITGLNPNVMYECGRRHETGKPCIIISRDDSLPFDVVTHPVIRYTLDGSAKDAIKTIQLIQQNVQHFVDLGFERTGNRTIADVFREVGGIGQKLDLILKRLTSSAVPGGDVISSTDKAKEAAEIVKKLGGAIPAMNYALANRDPELVDQLLPKINNKASKNFVMGGLVQGAALGSRVALNMMEPLISSNLDEFSWEERARIVGSYAAAASRLDEEERSLPIVLSCVDRMKAAIAAGELIERDAQTMMLNALQRVHHGTNNFEEAVRIGRQVLELAPEVESFWFNQSLNYQRLGDIKSSVEHVERLAELLRKKDFVDSDDDHLAHVIQIFLLGNRIDEAREFFLVLESQHPFRAQIIRAADEYEQLFI